jgi:pantothenate kinase
MTPELTELVERARALRGAGVRRLLGIAGAPGAGKSTLAAALAAKAGAVVVPMDGFHLSNEELRRLGRLDRKGAPDTFDVAGYAALLRRLRDDPDIVLAPEFDRAAESVVPDAISVQPGELVITEGNYLLLDSTQWPNVRALLDEVWFIETDESARMERLVARFVDHGWQREVARERVENGSDAANAQLVALSRANASLVIVEGEHQN